MSDVETNVPVMKRVRSLVGGACALVCMGTFVVLLVIGDGVESRFLATEYREPRYELGKDIAAKIKGAEIYVDQSELALLNLYEKTLPMILIFSGAGVAALGMDWKRRPKDNDTAR